MREHGSRLGSVIGVVPRRQSQEYNGLRKTIRRVPRLSLRLLRHENVTKCLIDGVGTLTPKMSFRGRKAMTRSETTSNSVRRGKRSCLT